MDLWNAETKQATGGDAVAAACGVLLAMPPNTTLVVPSDFFASALTFDCQSLGKGRRVLSLAAYAEKEEEKAEAETRHRKKRLFAVRPAIGGGRRRFETSVGGCEKKEGAVWRSSCWRSGRGGRAMRRKDPRARKKRAPRRRREVGAEVDCELKSAVRNGKMMRVFSRLS